MKAAALLLFAATAASAQAPGDSARAAQDSALRVFLDCPDYFCDFDYFRTEITFVNWVRDRGYAQIHVLLTSQRTGGGGREFTVAFIGLERFEGTADTLRWVAGNTATDDEVRRGLARTTRLGLVRFAARTPVAEGLEILYSAPPQAAAQVRDPWNYWVLRVNTNGNFNGEKTFKFQNVSGSISADRVTEAWKVQLSANESYSQSDFTVTLFDSAGNPSGEDAITSIRRSYGANGLVVRSVGPHWSVGLRASASASTFLNQDLALTLGPAIEFDVYPYSESTRRLLTIRYQIGVAAFDYRDTTIFNRLEETRYTHSLSVSLDVKQPWGSTGLALEGSHFLHDFSKNKVVLFGNGDFRIYKGLSFRLVGDIELIHDQLFLSKEGASEQEVLLRRRQLETSFRYFAFFGLSYTFGSKFANIVNPRFGGAGGSFFFF